MEQAAAPAGEEAPADDGGSVVAASQSQKLALRDVALKREKAKAELYEIIVDKSLAWRQSLWNSMGESMKSSALDDPDMWPFVRRGAKVVLDHVWTDVEHEIETSIQASVAKQKANADIPGPRSDTFIVAMLLQLRAFFLHHWLPHNRSFFGCIKDPVYLIIYVATLIPSHGVRVVLFGVLLVMLLFPGPPDEYQLMNFILVFKRTQFLTSGIISLLIGAMNYYVCYSLYRVDSVTGALRTPDMIQCMDSNGASSPGHAWGLLGDYMGNVLLVWIACFALPHAKNHGNENRQGLEQETAPVEEDTWFRNRWSQGFQVRSGRGGRLGWLIYYDLRCFGASLIVMAILTLTLCHREVIAMQGFSGDPQFRANVYWCCVFYSLLSAPFGIFTVPGVLSVLCHSDTSGYNQHGACVPFKISSLTAADGASGDTEEEQVDESLYARFAHVAVKIVRAVERGQDARGEQHGNYRFGDATRGFWLRWRDRQRGRFSRSSARDPEAPDEPATPPRPEVRSRTPRTARSNSSVARAAQAEAEVTLDVSKASLLSEMDTRDGHVFFRIQCEPYESLDGTYGGDPWIIQRRYGQFAALAKDLGRPCESWPDAPLPRKTMRSCAGERLQARRLALDVWLQRVLQEAPLHAGWPARLKQFLEQEDPDGDGQHGEQETGGPDVETGISSDDVSFLSVSSIGTQGSMEKTGSMYSRLLSEGDAGTGGAGKLGFRQKLKKWAAFGGAARTGGGTPASKDALSSSSSTYCPPDDANGASVASASAVADLPGDVDKAAVGSGVDGARAADLGAGEGHETSRLGDEFRHTGSSTPSPLPMISEAQETSFGALGDASPTGRSAHTPSRPPEENAERPERDKIVRPE
eukprot:TRINITY_DN48939_c0_g1_i1.p1 TRINITY_DN48939_c0_g1~~TRINITY_DN48939_c0_g1_i1.p1  ORF type:complete len:866 (+),score=190.21 TRINITY_DN48939_c0_g1_i1:163-2760(+)